MSDCSASIQDSYATDIFYILTLWSTKLSVVLLFLRLSPYETHKLVSCIFIGASAVLITISVFIISLRCEIAEPWLFVGIQCPGLVSGFRVCIR